MDRKDKAKAAAKVLPGLMKSMEKCDLCARRCGVNRLKGEIGECGAGAVPVVFRYDAHHGEEPPISGEKGSGTIFFSHCNMSCVYCQNYTFSQSGEGREVSSRRLGEEMLDLQGMGCHNVNLVSPTHYAPFVVEAMQHACREGLNIPVVYNTGGYDSMEVIQALEGLVDIYLPDMRYSSDAMAVKYSNAPGYVANNRLIVKEMFRQVGNLKTRGNIAARGLVIRLLVLPEGISGTPETLDFIARFIGTEVPLSVMSQYYPTYKASRYKELSRRILPEEYLQVTEKLEKLGFKNGWVQPMGGGFDARFAGETFELNI